MWINLTTLIARALLKVNIVVGIGFEGYKSFFKLCRPNHQEHNQPFLVVDKVTKGLFTYFQRGPYLLVVISYPLEHLSESENSV